MSSGKLADVYYEVGYKVDDKGLKEADKKVKVVGENVIKAESRIKKSMSAIVNGTAVAVGAAGVAAVAYINKATEEYAAFEDQLLKVNAKGDMTTESFNKLKDAAFEAGKNTRFSATEAAKGLEYMAMAGWNAEKSIKALPAVLDTAIVAGEDLGLVSDILTDQMTVFGLSADKAAHFADILAYSANKSNTTIAALGDAMKYAGPPLKGLGTSAEETAALFMSLADGGIKASQAGTTLRAMSLRLINPSKEATMVMKKLGLEIKDKTTGSFVGMTKVLEQLEQKTKKYTNVQRAQIYAVLFGQEAVSGANVLLDQGTEKIRKNTEALKTNTGYAKKAAEYMNSGLQGSLMATKSKQEALSLAIGETFAPAKLAAVKSYNDLLDGTIQKLQQNKEATSEFGYFTAGVIKSFKAGASRIGEELWATGKSLGGMTYGTLDALSFGGLSKFNEYAYNKFVDIGMQDMAEANLKAKEIQQAKAPELGIKVPEYLRAPSLTPQNLETPGKIPLESPKIAIPEIKMPKVEQKKQNNNINMNTNVGGININITTTGTEKLDEIKLSKLIRKEIDASNKKTLNMINPGKAVEE